MSPSVRALRHQGPYRTCGSRHPRLSRVFSLPPQGDPQSCTELQFTKRILCARPRVTCLTCTISPTPHPRSRDGNLCH